MGNTTGGQSRLLRNSERGSFKRCEFQWYWNFVELLKPDEDAKALRFGDLVHQALAKYYKKGTKRGPHPARTFKKLYEAQWEELGKMNMRADDDQKWLDAGDLGHDMLTAYVEKYKDRDASFKILSTEQTFQLPVTITRKDIKNKFLLDLCIRANILPLRIVVVGTVDGLANDLTKDPDDVFFFEHKTAKAIDLAGLPMDEQAGTYWTYAPRWFWRQGLLKEGLYPTHILYNFLRKAMQDTRPENELGQKLNQDGSVSKKQPSKYFERQPIYRDHADRVNMHNRLVQEAVRMELVRRGILDPLKNPGPLYNPNCRGCPFRDPCELHETGADFEPMIASLYHKWDPYDAHEIVERW